MTDLVHKAGRSRASWWCWSSCPTTPLRPRSARAAARRVPRCGRLLGRATNTVQVFLFFSVARSQEIGSWERANGNGSASSPPSRPPRCQERHQPQLRHEHADDEQRVRHRDVAQRRLKPASARPAPRTRPPAPLRRGAAGRSRRQSPASSQRPSVWRSSLRRCEKADGAPALPRRAGSTVRSAGGSGIMRTTAESTRGGGSKDSGGTSSTLDAVAPLQHHRQAAVVLAAGRGGHAVDHLLLQHEVLVDHMCAAAAGETGWAWRCCRAGCRPRAAARLASASAAKSTFSTSASTTSSPVRRSGRPGRGRARSR
jgi:hypothetical protein